MRADACNYFNRLICHFWCVLSHTGAAWSPFDFLTKITAPSTCRMVCLFLNKCSVLCIRISYNTFYTWWISAVIFFQDMYEKDNTLYLSADVAGYKKDQIKVRVSVRTTYTWMTALVYVVWNRLTEIVLFIILYLRWRFLSCVSMVIFWPSVPLQRWRSLKKRYANAWQL